jgi:SEC-C motif domain protein
VSTALKQYFLCPCGSARAYQACCEPYHLGEVAPTAQALMRSRYCAYARGSDDYVLTTWHSSTRPSNLHEKSGDKPLQWIGLKVLSRDTDLTKLNDENAAVVEFVTTYRLNGRAHKLHEVSRFVREDGRWFYVDRQVP